MKWMQSNTSQPPYLVYPWFLLGAHLSDTARLLYCLLLNRAKLSQSNSWIDDDGNVFVYTRSRSWQTPSTAVKPWSEPVCISWKNRD